MRRIVELRTLTDQHADEYQACADAVDIIDEHVTSSAALEMKAVALIRQYGFFLPKPAKAFFGELADFLNWQDLKKEL